MLVSRMQFSKSCENCSYEQQEKCTKAFIKEKEKINFVHCNTNNCNLLKIIGF
jgi:hypothetical protein